MSYINIIHFRSRLTTNWDHFGIIVHDEEWMKWEEWVGGEFGERVGGEFLGFTVKFFEEVERILFNVLRFNKQENKVRKWKSK